jgi:PAS domain S-box-containing protein
MPAFLISGSNARIIASNGLATGADGPPEGRTCHEALAGRATPCEFCPLSQMLAGNADPYTRVNQARFGRRTAVSVRPVILTDKTILVLELVEDLGALPESLGNQLRTEEFEPHDSESAALLYYIARLILKRGASRRKLTRIIDMLEKYSDELKHSGLWIEIDGNYAGRATGASEKGRTITGIEVNRTARGRIGAQEPSRLGPGSKALLAQCAAMLSRRMEIEDRLLRIGRATLKSRRRAANLAREMWNRTEALAKETGYLQGILNSSQDIIITTDLEGRIVEFNPGAENRLGFTAEEMYGRLVTDLWENAEEREEIMKVVSSRGSVSNHETRLRTKSGEFVEISLTLSKLIDSEGRVLGTVGVSKDISREVAIRRELEAMNQNFRETINFISHESKNSLMVIGGFIRRLLNNEADPQKAEQLKIVYHHSKFLEAMSRDFLVMSDLEQGNLHCRKEWIEDVREEVIIPAMIGLKERYPDSFEKYEPEPDDIPKVSLMGNRDLLEIVFRNLFGNALKYMKPGGKIRYGIKPYLEGYLFNVWNDGPGIPNSETEKIFEKFYRIHDENTKGKRGTGLGLYNIRKIIEGHKGRIWCETEPGEWINFLFTIPGNNTGASND